MTTYARIIDDKAIDVTTGDPSTLFHPEVAVQFVEVPDGTQNGATRDPGTGIWSAPPVVPDPEPPVPPVSETDWLIDIGPFFDRFGTSKMAVLMSTSATVKAIVEDVSVRKWVDLRRADVPMALTVIASIVPEVTPELQTAILHTPVSPEDNVALRKLYFS